MHNQNATHLSELAAEIVGAYVSKNSVRPEELGSVIADVYSALKNAPNGRGQEPEPQTPAVPIKKSVTPDYLISLEDGRKFKSLKRHLKNSYGLTPAEYRAKWGLPRDYPMVAPNYAKARSEIAKASGLGQKASATRTPAPASKRSRRPKAAAQKRRAA